MGSAKREQDIAWRGAPSYQPCQEQPGSRKKESSDHLGQFSGSAVEFR